MTIWLGIVYAYKGLLMVRGENTNLQLIGTNCVYECVIFFIQDMQLKIVCASHKKTEWTEI